MVESELGQIKLYIWCCSAASLRRKAALELFCHLSLRTRNAFTTTPLLLRCYMVIIRSRPPLLFIYQLEKPATPLRLVQWVLTLETYRSSIVTLCGFPPENLTFADFWWFSDDQQVYSRTQWHHRGVWSQLEHHTQRWNVQPERAAKTCFLSRC